MCRMIFLSDKLLVVGYGSDKFWAYLGYTNSSQPVRVYQNNGGTLNSTPVWTSAVTGDNWSVALGDIDNDGDLDLATGGQT